MKIKYFATLAVATVISVSATTSIYRPAVVNAAPCAGNPCASKNPCAGNPCAGNPCASKNPCAGNPCAGKNPCAGNPCAGNPCASKNPCAGKTSSANPCAAKSSSGIPVVYTDPAADDNLAVRGYDVVAYFTESQPVKGEATYSYDWKGATWQFSSEANLDKFKENPEAYAPQYGGYCAKAMSEGNVVSTVPEAWAIEDDKLYLNFSKEVQAEWKQDTPGNIEKADANWPSVLDTAEGVFYDTVQWVQY